METEFGAGHSRHMQLCYDVRHFVITTLGCLELIEEQSSDKSTAEKGLKTALKSTRVAAQKVEELYQEICKAEDTLRALRDQSSP